MKKDNYQPIGSCRIAALVLVAIALSAISGSAATYTATYQGGGIWEQDGGNWSTIAYPQNGHFVTINGNPFPDGNPSYNVAINIATPCTLSIGVAVQTVNVANGATLNLANNATIHATTGLGNNGVITLNSTGNGSHLRLANGSVLGSTGQMLLSDSATNYISAINHGDTLTIAAGGIIRGAGQLNLGFFGDLEHLLNFVNHGLIDATKPVNALAIGIQNDNNTNSNLTNDGTLRASGSGILRIRTFGGSATVFDNAGTISAIDYGKVRIGPGVTVTGGTLVTANNGTISGDGPGGGGGVLKDLTNTGLVAIADRESITLAGTFTNNGSVTLNSIGNGAILRFASGTTLAGSGAVTLSNNGSNYFMAAGFGDALTIAPSATIQGAGNISPGFSGGSNMLKITNQGLIHANISGAALVIRAEESNGTPFTNAGTLRASNGATLSFNGTSTLTNNGGTIQVLPASTISAGGGITLLQTAGTIDLAGGSMSFPLGVDLNGGQLIGNGNFTGPIRNNGGMVAPGHSPGKITVTGNYTQGEQGVLNIQIGGTTPGTGFDQLKVSGTVSLGGTLNITFINGFKPNAGQTFLILASPNITGAFHKVNGADLMLTPGGVVIKPLPAISHLQNVSTRLKVLTGDKVLIGGFIVTGSESKKILIRGIGPSLTAFGVVGALVDPILELHKSGGVVVTNDNWKATQQAAIQATGIAPKNDLESAILATLPPGSYTAIVRGKNNGMGVALVEGYDLDAAAASQLANISTRGFVDTKDNVMIGGFIVGGGGGANSRVVVRAIGPSLTTAGVTGALTDPTLELRNANGALIGSNDNWKSSQQASLQATGIAPQDDRESAILASLPDGNYTAIVRGKSSTTGVGLVEVYNVP